MVWGGDKISFTQGVVADRHRHQQVLHDVTNKYEDSLKEIQGVVGAGMGFVHLNKPSMSKSLHGSTTQSRGIKLFCAGLFP